MKLSKRLKTIANMIDDVDYLFDVGCDHAKLDIFITNTRQDISCIAIDVNDNVITNTKKVIESLNLQNKIKVIKNDGLKNLNIPFKSVVVVSGLGNKTILNILKEATLPKYLILQTNNDEYFLKKEVIKIGYEIIDEAFLTERGYDYVISKYVKKRKKYSEFDKYVSPLLSGNIDYLKYRIKKLKTKYKYNKNIFKKLKYKIWMFKIKNKIKKLYQ